MRRRLSCALASAVLVLAAGVAAAATDDHLDCVKIKDPTIFKARLDLATRLGDKSNCDLKVRSAFLCTPATKSLITSTAPSVAFDGQTMSDAKLCYKITCSKLNPPNPTAFDQFGERHVTRLTPRLVCTPAAVF